MKKNILVFLVIMLISTLVIAGLGVTYALYFQGTVRDTYQEIYTDALNSAAAVLNEKITASFNLFDAEFTEVPDGFFGYGQMYYDGGEDAHILTITLRAKDYPNGEPYPAKIIDQKIYSIISGATAGNTSARNIAFTTQFGKHLIVYSLKTSNTVFRVLYQEYNSFLNFLSPFLFQSVSILDDNGFFIADTTGDTAKLNTNTVYDMFSYSDFGDLSSFENKLLPLAGETQFLTVTPISIENHYLMGYLPSSAVDARINKEIERNNVFVVMVCIVSFLGSGIIIMIFLMLSNTYVTGSIARGKYSLFVNKKGNIVKRNALFSSRFDRIANVYSAMDNVFNDKIALSGKDVVLKLLNKEGNVHYINFLCSQTVYGFRMLGSDITDRANSFIEANYLSNCNPLTRLPTMQQLELDFLEILKETPEEQFIFQYVEMLNMEQYRVMFGNIFYEKMKVSFARRLEAMFPRCVYHTGETQFLLFGKTTVTTLSMINESNSHIAKLSAPFQIDVQKLLLEFKAGRSKPFYGNTEPILAEYLNQARISLQTAQRSADKTVVAYFDALIQGDAVTYENRQAVIDLIEDDQLIMHYQPQFNQKTGKIAGFEALLRVKKKINITVLEFIQQAERNGGIVEIGNFVTKSAMAFAKQMEKYKITVSINISPVQLLQEGFAESFLQMYREFDLKKNSVAIEITESFLMSNFNRSVKILGLFSQEGISIHLDDFGVEYSSMLYLKRLPIDVIKIDREFIKDINFNGYSKMIVDIITKSAKHLKMLCIAEGVEMPEQLKALKELDCEIIQGFLISKALPEVEAVQLVESYLGKSDKK